MTEKFKRLYFMIVFALVFYVVGAAFVESFVNYPTWKLIGANEFKNYHQGLSALIIKTMVLPWLVEILLNILLLWLRPRIVPRGAVAAALIFNAIILISTVTIQIPIQARLSADGFSADLIDKLLATDPVRWTFGIFKALLYLWMMSLVVLAADSASGRGADTSRLGVGESDA